VLLKWLQKRKFKFHGRDPGLWLNIKLYNFTIQNIFTVIFLSYLSSVFPPKVRKNFKIWDNFWFCGCPHFASDPPLRQWQLHLLYSVVDSTVSTWLVVIHSCYTSTYQCHIYKTNCMVLNYSCGIQLTSLHSSYFDVTLKCILWELKLSGLNIAIPTYLVIWYWPSQLRSIYEMHHWSCYFSLVWDE
jgi:hypothetical protein